MLNLLLTVLAWILRKITGNATAEAVEHGKTLERYEQAKAVIEATKRAKNDAEAIDRMADDAVFSSLDELHRFRHPE